MDTKLAGKNVLITGAANGIGRATALAFAAEGANLALVDLDRAGLDELATAAGKVGARVGLGVADLSTATGVAAGIDEALGPFARRVDVLVNNVGSGYVRTFDQLTDEDWSATFELNFMSTVRACRKVLPAMRQNQGGVIVKA